MLLGLFGAALAGCTWLPPQLPPPTTATSIPATTVPPTTGPTTIPGTPQDCGTIRYASGWPTTTAMLPSNPMIDCIRSAFASGHEAKLITREQTDGLGGHILITTYETVGVHQLVLTVDRTGALDPPHDVTRSACSELTFEVPYLHAGNCHPI